MSSQGVEQLCDTLATAEKGEKTHGDALICSGKAEYRRAGSSKGKEKQLQCEEIHLCLFCLLI